jgi:hypothetical protein
MKNAICGSGGSRLENNHMSACSPRSGTPMGDYLAPKEQDLSFAMHTDSGNRNRKA